MQHLNAYQHVRAKHFKDHAAAAKIIAVKSPTEAKRISYTVRNYNEAEWGRVRDDLMRIQVEFAPGSEMPARLQVSGTKLLAESGKDKFFSCGMSLTHPDILDSTKWKSNMLGKLQMEIRDKLNKSYFFKVFSILSLSNMLHQMF